MGQSHKRRLQRVEQALSPRPWTSIRLIVTDEHGMVIDARPPEALERWRGRHYSELPPDEPWTHCRGIDIGVILGERSLPSVEPPS